MVGDQLLTNIFHIFQDSKNDNPRPYLYDNYNISCWYRSPLTNNVISRLTNSITDGLNSSVQLPKYILMTPDWDIIKGIQLFDYGVVSVI